MALSARFKMFKYLKLVSDRSFYWLKSKVHGHSRYFNESHNKTIFHLNVNFHGPNFHQLNCINLSTYKSATLIAPQNILRISDIFFSTTFYAILTFENLVVNIIFQEYVSKLRVPMSHVSVLSRSMSYKPSCSFLCPCFNQHQKQ